MKKARFIRFLALIPLLLDLNGCGISSITREKRIENMVHADFGIEDPQFTDAAGPLLGNAFVGGNKITELKNGSEIFPSMLEAIKGAQRTINMEMYIWSSGTISDEFIDALSERARAGVKVNVLIDALGSAKLRHSDRQRLRDAKVDLQTYDPPISFKFFRSNYRTHRKILVVDGRIGFIGGVCINDDWDGYAEKGKWRDTQLRVEGPVVAQMQGVLTDNWVQMRSEVWNGQAYFPALPPAGSMRAQCIKSGPFEGAEVTRIAYFLAFASARKTIRIEHAYFAPDDLMIDTLLDAIKRGVKVQILVPHKNDNMAVDKASKPRWEKLMKAGAEFYEYQPTLLHCKIVIVDDVWSCVGSVNFDERSFRINDEANLNVLDAGFAATLIQSFDADKAKSKRLTEKEFEKRSVVSKFFERFSGLFSSQL